MCFLQNFPECFQLVTFLLPKRNSSRNICDILAEFTHPFCCCRWACKFAFKLIQRYWKLTWILSNKHICLFHYDIATFDICCPSWMHAKCHNSLPSGPFSQNAIRWSKASARVTFKSLLRLKGSPLPSGNRTGKHFEARPSVLNSFMGIPMSGQFRIGVP